MSAPFTVLRPHADDGPGQLSVVRDERLRREVALKALTGPAADDPIGRQRFVEEAKITGQLQHPGVVPVYALGTDSAGHCYYTTKLVCGRKLDEVIGTRGMSRTPTGTRELLRRFVMVCQTIAFAHARGILHRNLKSENILLGECGETLVLDWGSAKRLPGAGSLEASQGTPAEQRGGRGPATVEAGGAPDSAAPHVPLEAASGQAEGLDPATDIRGLGTVLHHILTGQPARADASSDEAIERAGAADAPKHLGMRRRVPRPMAAICLKAMACRPEDLYPTANALAADVQAWLNDEPVAAHVESRIEQLGRWSRRHRAMLANSVLLLFVLIVVISVVAAVVGRAGARTKAAETLAARLGRQAVAAERQAGEKEQEAARRSNEARKARAEAAQSIRMAMHAARTAEEAKTRVQQLETDLKIKTAQTEELERQIEQARADLAAAEARVTAETERALAANRRLESLQAEETTLRLEAGRLRALSGQLAQLAAGSEEPQPQASGTSDNAWEDFTEQGAAAFAVNSADKAISILTSDTSYCCNGRCSLRLDTLSGSEVTVTYPATRDAEWNLAAQKQLSLALSVDDARTSFRPGFPRIRIGRGSSWIQLEPQADVLDKTVNTWTRASVPIAGDATWKRTEVNHPDLSGIDWIEICVAAENRGFGVWFDAVGIEPPRGDDPIDAQQARPYEKAWAGHLRAPMEGTNLIRVHAVERWAAWHRPDDTRDVPWEDPRVLDLGDGYAPRAPFRKIGVLPDASCDAMSSSRGAVSGHAVHRDQGFLLVASCAASGNARTLP